MFIDISIILARAESLILFLDEEKRRCLWRVGWANFPRGKIFIEEVFGSFSFILQQWVYLPYLLGEGIVEVDFMVIRPGGRNMIGGLFREHRGEREIFWGKMGFSLVFLAVAPSSVAVVSLVMIGDPAGIKRDPHQMIWWMAAFCRAQMMYSFSVSHLLYANRCWSAIALMLT